MIVRALAAWVVLSASLARAELPKPDVLKLMPRAAECMAQLDVERFHKWSFSDRLLDSLPKLTGRLREMGVYPIDGIKGVSGATMRAGPKKSDGVFVVDGQTRGRGIALGGDRFVIGAGRWPADVAKRARESGDSRAPLAGRAAEADGFSMRGACLATAELKASLRKDFPEIDGADHVTFHAGFGEGLDLAGSIVLRTEAAAAAMLAKLKQIAVKLRTGRVAGIISLKSYVEPLSLSQHGARIDFTYPMKPQLLEQTLGMIALMRNLGESSGDPVR